MKRILAIPMLLYAVSAFAQNNNIVINPAGTTLTATAQTLPSAGIVMGYSFWGGTITLTGSSLTTATFGVLASTDNGASYYAWPICTVAATPVCATTQTATANGQYTITLGTVTNIKFVTSGTFTGTNINLILTASTNASSAKLGGGSSGGGAPTGPAGGDLSGTYPNPGVAQVNGAAVPTSQAVVGTNSNGQFIAGSASASACVPLGTYTAANSATLDIVTRTAAGTSGAIFQSDYDVYEFVFNSLVPATTTTNQLYWRLTQNGGSTWDSGSNYTTVNLQLFASGNPVAALVATASQFQPHSQDNVVGGAAGGGANGSFRVFAPLNTAGSKRISGDILTWDGTTYTYDLYGLIYLQTAAVNGLRFLFQNGNITSGSVRVCGRTN